MKAWRYAYNDSGNLVGTSDARGCGKNTEWDGAGRILSETFSPCLRHHPEYDERPAATYHYDAPEPGQDVEGSPPSFFIGQLAASYDRGQHSRYVYDGRGRAVSTSRQIAIPNEDADPVTEYAPHWFRKATAFDSANRVIAQTTGADVEELLGQPVTVDSLTGRSIVTTSYTNRGIANRVSGSYGDLITSRTADADGFTRFTEYGDVAKTTATFVPDARRRLSRSLIKRNRPAIWDSPPPGYTAPPPATAQTVLQDLRFDAYDPSDNPLLVNDARIVDEWPAGAKPVTKQLSYDDLDRLRRVDYATGDDTQVSPFAAEAQAGDRAPIPEGPQTHRVKWQKFDFDWQGNLRAIDDDAHAFFDRSIGTATHGTASNGPNRLVSATLGDGKIDAIYDPAGNVTRMLVKKKDPHGDAINLLFVYEWDEVGRLTRARRLSRAEIPLIDILGILVLQLDLSGTDSGGVDLRYTYDAGGQRVIKSATNRRNFARTYSIEVFSTLRLDDARYFWEEDAYERTAETETAYLVSNGAAIARVVHGTANLPTLDGKQQHVYLTMTDPLGSTTAVVDKATSELVERSTYLALGQAETDYRPERWKSFREHYRFTGKEDDVGVGLTYFGARYYVAALGQWASADPLTIHGMGSDLNPYAYVMGSPQRLVDPMGLQACSGFSCSWDNFVGGTGTGGPTGWMMPAASRNPFRNGANTGIDEGTRQGKNLLFTTPDGQPFIPGVGLPGALVGIEVLYGRKNQGGSVGGTKNCNPANMSCAGNEVEVYNRLETLWFWMMDSRDPRLNASMLNSLGDDLDTAGDVALVGAHVVSVVIGAEAMAGMVYGTVRLVQLELATQGGISIAGLLGGTAAQGMKSIQPSLNRAAGNAFRDEIAASLENAGREVQTEVFKSTPMGARYIDIEVRQGGEVLGGIETKLGNSPYTAPQRAKDEWLWRMEGYRVNVVRGKAE